MRLLCSEERKWGPLLCKDTHAVTRSHTNGGGKVYSASRGSSLPRSVAIPERRWEVGSSTERVCSSDGTTEQFPFLQNESESFK